MAEDAGDVCDLACAVSLSDNRSTVADADGLNKGFRLVFLRHCLIRKGGLLPRYAAS